MAVLPSRTSFSAPASKGSFVSVSPLKSSYHMSTIACAPLQRPYFYSYSSASLRSVQLYDVCDALEALCGLRRSSQSGALFIRSVGCAPTGARRVPQRRRTPDMLDSGPRGGSQLSGASSQRPDGPPPLRPLSEAGTRVFVGILGLSRGLLEGCGAPVASLGRLRHAPAHNNITMCIIIVILLLLIVIIIILSLSLSLSLSISLSLSTFFFFFFLLLFMFSLYYYYYYYYCYYHDDYYDDDDDYYCYDYYDYCDYHDYCDYYCHNELSAPFPRSRPRRRAKPPRSALNQEALADIFARFHGGIDSWMKADRVADSTSPFCI